MTGKHVALSVEELDRNEADFRTMLQTARTRLLRRDGNAAAAHAQAAAFFAWLNHTGRFSSAELEGLLASAAALVRDADRRSGAVDHWPRDGSPTLLHVATQTYSTGGHTQMLAQWIAQDAGARHRLALTRQATVPVPTKLATLSTLERMTLLDRRPGGLLARAGRLRTLAREADLVVLHTHPYDVVPSLALSCPDMPPVVMVNHADHAFWVGVQVSDVLASLRHSGSTLAVTRRGVEAERCRVMTRPLAPGDRTRSRGRARAELGLPEDAIVLATAADGSKYESIGGPSFLDLVLPAVRRHPSLTLVAAGPQPDGAWAEAGRSTDGRVIALGRIDDVRLLHEAADIYLDSFPFASLTSMLEAASFGTPVVTYRGHGPECDILGADSMGLDEHMLTPATPERLVHTLLDLANSSRQRLERGARTQRAVDATHRGSGWIAVLEELRDAASHGVRRPVTMEQAPRMTGVLDGMVAGVQAQTAHHRPADEVMAAHLPLLPFAQRTVGWAKRPNRARQLRLLLPEWWTVNLTVAYRRALQISARKRRSRRASSSRAAAGSV